MSSIISNKEELKQQFISKYSCILSQNFAEEMVNFIFDNIKLSEEQKVENFDFDSMFEGIQQNNTNTPNFTKEDVKRFVNEINGALKDNIHRNNITLHEDGKNDSNNLKDTVRLRETHRLGRNMRNDVENIIMKNTYEDAILLGNFFVSSIFDYNNNFHKFEGGVRRSLIAPNVSRELLKYEGLSSAEKYYEILCKKLEDILKINLYEAQIFFGNELARILPEKR